jgi:hypothetical protein
MLCNICVFFSVLPPPISPLVAIADMERAVINVMKVEIAMMINVCPIVFYKSIYSNYQFTINLDLQIPERATTQEIRRKSMTPQMLNMLRMRTPSIQPNLSPNGSWTSLASGLASCCFQKRKFI